MHQQRLGSCHRNVNHRTRRLKFRVLLNQLETVHPANNSACVMWICEKWVSRSLPQVVNY